MARVQRDGGQGKVMPWLVVLAAMGTACATLETEPETPKERPASDGSGFGTANDQAKLHACYASALPHYPELSVHTVALYFARDQKIVFVDVELPETPELARCLREAILSWKTFAGPPVAQVPRAIASGGFRIDLGPPLTTPAPRPTLAEASARQRRMTLEALQQGVLRDSDPIVREMRNPPAPWPTAQMRAELDACHRDALESHPGLVLHRNVITLTRGGRILLADVSIPEAPELRRCVLDRIVTWSSPFSIASETVVSGFFMHLGGPDEFPDPPADLTAELARRDALVQRALQLGLMKADDPLMDRLRPAPPAPPRDPKAAAAPGPVQTK